MPDFYRLKPRKLLSGLIKALKKTSGLFQNLPVSSGRPVCQEPDPLFSGATFALFDLPLASPGYHSALFLPELLKCKKAASEEPPPGAALILHTAY